MDRCSAATATEVITAKGIVPATDMVSLTLEQNKNILVFWEDGMDVLRDLCALMALTLFGQMVVTWMGLAATL
jgi:hypothetical protein